MDMYGSTVKERIETFEKLHGDSVFDGAWIWFEDGARRDANALGPLVEPPESPRELQHNVCMYLRLRLDGIVLEFDKLKAQLQQNPGTDPNDENVKKLRKLRANAQHIRKKLQHHQEELRKASPGYVSPEDAEIIREHEIAEAARKQRFSETVNAITI